MPATSHTENEEEEASLDIQSPPGSNLVCVDFNLTDPPHAHYRPEEHLSEAEYKQQQQPSLVNSRFTPPVSDLFVYPAIDPQLDEAHLIELGYLRSTPPSSSPNSPMTRTDLEMAAVKGSPRYRRLWLWNTLTSPSFSQTARLYSYYLDLLVVISTVLLLVESVPTWNEGGLKFIWFGVESFITGHFFLDFVGKLASAPALGAYLWSLGCLLDGLSIIPWAAQVAWILTAAHGSARKKGWTILRLIRLLRFGRFFQAALMGVPEMRLFWKAVQRSRLAVLFLVCYLFGAGIFFSCCLYLAETAGCHLDSTSLLWLDEAEAACPIQNMFDALWLTLVTMTTVGYGDVTPKTAAGKTVATLIMIASMVFLALPVSIFGANLTELYLENRLAKKILRRKRTRHPHHPPQAPDEHDELLDDEPPSPPPAPEPQFAMPHPPPSRYQHSIISQTSLHSPSSMAAATATVDHAPSLTQVSCPPFFSMRHTVNIYAILEAMEITMEEVSNDIVLSRRRLDLIERQHRQLEALLIGRHQELDHHLQHYEPSPLGLSRHDPPFHTHNPSLHTHNPPLHTHNDHDSPSNAQDSPIL